MTSLSAKTVFISRSLEADSPLYKLPKTPSFVAESLLEFEALPVDNIPSSDWIFFYSKQAIDFFLRLQKPSNQGLAVMGEGSRAWLKKHQLKADFCGFGNPTQTAAAFAKVAQGQTVLFPRALHSKQSIQKMCAGQFEVLDLVTYKNSKRRDFKNPVADILVFTSPMNAEAYLDLYAILPEQEIISIGPTTSAFLIAQGYTPRQTKISSEASIAEALITLL